LLGPRDPFEVTRNGAETVAGADRVVAEVLDLLQHGIRPTVGKHVARKERNRRAVFMHRRRRRDHIGRAWPGGRGRRHRPFAVRLFRECNRGMGHALFIVAAIGWQPVADAMERVAHTGDVVEPEYAPDAGEKRFTCIVVLGGKIAHHGLRGGQSNCGHAASPCASARA
jgi:hypothetical protein